MYMLYISVELLSAVGAEPIHVSTAQVPSLHQYEVTGTSSLEATECSAFMTELEKEFKLKFPTFRGYIASQCNRVYAK